MNTIEQEIIEKEVLKEVKEEMMKKLIQKIMSEFEIGNIIPHEYLKDFFGLKMPVRLIGESDEDFLMRYNYYNFAYMGKIDELREKMLEQTNIYLRNIWSVGYELMKPKDQINFAVKQGISDAKDAIKKHLHIAMMTRIDNFTAEENRIATDMIVKLSRLDNLFRTIKSK